MDSLLTVHLCMIPLGNYHILPQHIRTLRIDQGIDPNTHLMLQMMNFRRVRMDSEQNIS